MKSRGCINCEELHENQKSQERQIAGLRSFAKHVEQFLDQANQGATAPSNFRPTPVLEQASVSLGHVPGASVSHLRQVRRVRRTLAQ